ncbi:chitinase-3-like protein 1 isoform X2 [Babylonia areolata]
MWLTTVIVVLFCSLCVAGGTPTVSVEPSRSTSNHTAAAAATADSGRMVVCYYTPTSYFHASMVPSHACTHLVYAFGSLSGGSSPSITTPTPGVKSIWETLVAKKRKNPGLKLLLSLQHGFPNVVGPRGTMQQFATNSVAFLRKYGFDGVDMDWEFPSSQQKFAFATFFELMRSAIDAEAKRSGRPALLLSLALPNNVYVADRSYDLRTIFANVDFATAMTYDFHLYNKNDNSTGYNSPLFSPTGESKYFSASGMAQYYMGKGFLASKLLLGIPTYGRSWKLYDPSSHGLHAPAIGKGDPGPVRKLTGVYTFPDACVALMEGATSVADSKAGAVYLYKGNSWVAYDDVTTVTDKCKWVLVNGLAGVGVWAMHLDDIAGRCGKGPLPLITAMNGILQGQTRALRDNRTDTPHHTLRHDPEHTPSAPPHKSDKTPPSPKFKQQTENHNRHEEEGRFLPSVPSQRGRTDLGVSDVMQHFMYHLKLRDERPVRMGEFWQNVRESVLTHRHRHPGNVEVFEENVDVPAAHP